MSALAWLLFAAAAATQASEHPQTRQTLELVNVVARGEAMAERRVGRTGAFFSQHLLTEAGIVMDIPDEAFEALRDRYELGRHPHFVLREWLEVGAGPDGGRSLRHLAFLHCDARVTWGTRMTCFRDADADDRLDSVAIFRMFDISEGGLQFQPVEPIPYHYVQQPRVPVEVRGGTYAGEFLGIAWNHAHRENCESGRLFFHAQVGGAGFRADIDPPVVVDVSQLPAAIEIAGAQLTVLAWDGRRPTVRVDRPFPDRPVRVVATDDAWVVVVGGSARHSGLEVIETPLPGGPGDGGDRIASPASH